MSTTENREAAFIGLITAGATHELRNVLAIVKESTGLIADIVDSGVTLAERLATRWQGSRAQKLAVLKEHCDFHYQQHFVLK